MSKGSSARILHGVKLPEGGRHVGYRQHQADRFDVIRELRAII